jgi:prepilin peptidase CpaA
MISEMHVLITSLLCCGMIIAASWDLKTGKIPNLLTFPLMLAGLTYHSALTGLSGLAFSACGLFVGIGILVIPYLLGGMGAGDAKLMGAVGSIVGSKGVIIAGVLSILLGLIYAIALLIIHSDYARCLTRRVGMTIKTLLLTGQFVLIPPRMDEKRPVLRYAVPIALGTIIYIVLKHTESHIIQDLLGFQFNI